VPTIKYYVREGLLPAGRLTSPNQADYDDAHERRLRLIRALLDVGGLKVAAVAEVLAAMDAPDRSVHKVLGAATDRTVPRYPGVQDEELEAAREEVAELIRRRGWRVDGDNPSVEALAGALAALERVGHGEFAELLDAYADAAERVARVDIAYVGRWAGLDDVVERSVVGTMLGEAMFASLRRMAHVDGSARAFGDGDATGERPDPPAVG
jgi:DNA-binding transcriptional MerR regulator